MGNWVQEYEFMRIGSLASLANDCGENVNDLVGAKALLTLTM